MNNTIVSSGGKPSSDPTRGLCTKFICLYTMSTKEIIAETHAKAQDVSEMKRR